MPLADLTAFSNASLQHAERGTADLFYAESWALTGMLAFSPGYAAGFQHVIAAEGAGLASMDVLTHDLRVWVDSGASAAVHLPRVSPDSIAVDTFDVTPLASRLLLAHLLLTAGEFDRAETLFAALPDSADVSAALGSIALHKGDLTAARSAWKRALNQGVQGVTDAQLCYRYAILADEAGMRPDDIRPALERAIALRPDFDDARYQLALLYKNAGLYEQALQQFQAMRVVPDNRAYVYSLALADTFNELGRRQEALVAAGHAAERASTATERAARPNRPTSLKPTLAFNCRDSSGHLTRDRARAAPNGRMEPVHRARRRHPTPAGQTSRDRLRNHHHHSRGSGRETGHAGHSRSTTRSNAPRADGIHVRPANTHTRADTCRRSDRVLLASRGCPDPAVKKKSSHAGLPPEARSEEGGGRLRKIESELQRVLAELIAREVKDPRVGNVTITGVKLAPDKGVAKVFFAPFASSIRGGNAQRPHPRGRLPARRSRAAAGIAPCSAAGIRVRQHRGEGRAPDRAH